MDKTCKNFKHARLFRGAAPDYLAHKNEPVDTSTARAVKVIDGERSSGEFNLFADSASEDRVWVRLTQRYLRRNR